MDTLGVDLAAQPADTALCRIAWRAGEARVEDLRCGVDDTALLAGIARVDKAGIDVPLGWPDPFVDAVAAHRRGGPWPGYIVRELCYRETDQVVAALTGRWPLSVASDRIAITAMRAGAVLGRLPTPVDRAGGGRVVEVYPAAALRRWGFDPRGYKRARGLAVRRELVAGFARRTRAWLRLDGAARAHCERSDDAFDALVAALVARASALGRCEPIPPGSAGRASREGWIALPAPDSLEHLA